MELWIRNQDKKQLIKCETLCIGEVNGLFYIVENESIDNDTFYSLGTYSTEKQALDVLDEIQKEIIISFTLQQLGKSPLMTLEEYDKFMENIVYQMPEDKGEDYENLH